MLRARVLGEKKCHLDEPHALHEAAERAAGRGEHAVRHEELAQRAKRACPHRQRKQAVHCRVQGLVLLVRCHQECLYNEC